MYLKNSFKCIKEIETLKTKYFIYVYILKLLNAVAQYILILCKVYYYLFSRHLVIIK